MNKIGSRIIGKVAEQHHLNCEDTEVVLFGFNLLMNSILGLGAIFIVAYILGIIPTVLAVTITSVIFRAFTGGAHANSPIKCIVFGAIIFNALGIIAVRISNIILETNSLGIFAIVIFGTAAISFFIFAPADTPGKPIATKVQRNKLRLLSFIFLIIWGTFMVCFRGATMYEHFVIASCIGLFWQSVSLWPVTYIIFGHK